jgi:hypothetical protein
VRHPLSAPVGDSGAGDARGDDGGTWGPPGHVAAPHPPPVEEAKHAPAAHGRHAAAVAAAMGAASPTPALAHNPVAFPATPGGDVTSTPRMTSPLAGGLVVGGAASSRGVGHGGRAASTSRVHQGGGGSELYRERVASQGDGTASRPPSVPRHLLHVPTQPRFKREHAHMDLHHAEEDDDYNVVLSGTAMEAALAGEGDLLSPHSSPGGGAGAQRATRAVAPEGILIGGASDPASPPAASADAATADGQAPAAGGGGKAAVAVAGMVTHLPGRGSGAGGLRHRRVTTHASVASSTDGAELVTECLCGSTECDHCNRSGHTVAGSTHAAHARNQVSRRVRESMVARHALLTPEEVRAAGGGGGWDVCE